MATRTLSAALGMGVTAATVAARAAIRGLFLAVCRGLFLVPPAPPPPPPAPCGTAYGVYGGRTYPLLYAFAEEEEEEAVAAEAEAEAEAEEEEAAAELEAAEWW